MTYFTPFLADVSSLVIPEKFTYPFNYSPEPLAILAASELQNYIQSEIEDKHPFGMKGESSGIGKMFGVLVVRNSIGQLGYISAFSGKLGKKMIMIDSCRRFMICSLVKDSISLKKKEFIS